MLYYLLEWLEQTYQPPGFQVIAFITFRAGVAAFTALILSIFVGKRIINWLRRQQLGEVVREAIDAGGIDHSHKAGTPTMGGVILLLSIVGATLLWGDLANPYVWLVMVATLWMGAFGFADDYIKVIKEDKSGLDKRMKIVGQVSIGLLVGAVLYLHPQFAEVRTLTNLPFVSNVLFDYDLVYQWFGIEGFGWVIYLPLVVFIITAVSNGVNLTDGLDGLAAGVTGIVAIGLLAISYAAGNSILADFLKIMYLPGASELAVYAAALAAACLGFLWYNGFPAQVFMGDTGSLALGAGIGTLAILVRAELLLPLLCGVFFVETLSVIIQTSYFKYTRRRTGTGQRVFLMAPLHHHYERRGVPEPKIVVRFWIVTALLVIATLITLRIR